MVVTRPPETRRYTRGESTMYTEAELFKHWRGGIGGGGDGGGRGDRVIWRTRVVILCVQRQGREGGSYREREGEGERDDRVIWRTR